MRKAAEMVAARSSGVPVVEAAACTEVPVAAMAVACTEAAMAVGNTWDARVAEANCVRPGRWAPTAVASVGPVAGQERAPPGVLVRYMKLRALACRLASPG